jgi:hypothetical protein
MEKKRNENYYYKLVNLNAMGLLNFFVPTRGNY